jgi:DNA-binding CsgD family transcriptional regulator
MAQGHLTKTAAIEMGISFETAKRHLKDARHSLRASTTTHAVALFLRGQEVA